MKNFKWYRKLLGGVWYYNRYRYDMNIVFVWERSLPTIGNCYNIRQENV